MGKPRSIQTGDTTAGARVEYVRSRRVLRLGGWHDRNRDIEPMEVPASRFLTDLGIEPGELGAAPLFILVGGVRDRPRSSIRNVVLAFPSELDGRQQFRLLRDRHQERDEWARLVTVDARCRVVPLCWFGEGVVEADASAGGAKRWPLRRLRSSRG